MKKPIAVFYLIWSALIFSYAAPAQEPGGGGSNPFAQAKFVPDISLVMDASYTQRNHRDAVYHSLLMPGFSSVTAEHPALDHSGVNSRQGFNFNYAELVVSSVVDPYFDLFVVCDFGEDTFGIEEAYFTTRRLAWGLQLKGGKFLSHFGRLNAQHTHQWDFADAPLVYAAFFGESLLNEKGVRLTWVAPLDIYCMLGGEIFQGENPMSFGRSGFSDPKGVVTVQESGGPDLAVAYAKTSVDWETLTLLGGISYASGMTRLNQGLEQGTALSQADYGHTHVAGIDMTIKYLFDSIRCLTVQAEYLLRSRQGHHYRWAGEQGVIVNQWDSRQAGFYGQLIGRFSKRFRAGLRYDLLHLNDVEWDQVRQPHPERLPRLSAMAEYNPTEFSRLRIQYNHDTSRYEPSAGHSVRKPNRELALQINLAIGAHGAHAF